MQEIFRFSGAEMLKPKTQSKQRGHAIIEVSLMAPWILFLFMGTMDFGFYAYSAVATENAARAAVERTAIDATTAADSLTACQYALTELKGMANARALSGCATSAGSVNSSQPVAVVATQVTGIDGTQASQVAVTYQAIPMFTIPGIPGQYTITRTAQMRLRDQ